MRDEVLQFPTRDDFRAWLAENGQTSEGVWLRFGKTAAVQTLKAGEALEEALCFGWIDGVMKRVDDQSYIKYFAQRRRDSKWSDKNKALAEDLEKRGLMTDLGREQIKLAKQDGRWEAGGKIPTMTDEQMETVEELLKGNEVAYRNFLGMSPSVRKTYTRAYFDAKTDTGRQKRLAWMMERLERNLKPM